MISAVNGVSSPQVAEPAPASQPASNVQVSPQTSTTSSDPKPSVPVDTVTISSAARALTQELHETPAQTQREANAGDLQAKRLMAREAAAHLQ
jgi:hypothetical protein